MWTYRQATGEVLLDGERVAVGYSGAGEGHNNPALEAVPNVGPIPRGRYAIGPRYDTETHGPIVMHLSPAATTETHGRGGFLIHGDSVRAPGTASHGCIILDRMTRLRIAASSDHELEVVA